MDNSCIVRGMNGFKICNQREQGEGEGDILPSQLARRVQFRCGSEPYKCEGECAEVIKGVTWLFPKPTRIGRREDDAAVSP